MVTNTRQEQDTGRYKWRDMPHDVSYYMDKDDYGDRARIYPIGYVKPLPDAIGGFWGAWIYGPVDHIMRDTPLRRWYLSRDEAMRDVEVAIDDKKSPSYNEKAVGGALFVWAA